MPSMLNRPHTHIQCPALAALGPHSAGTANVTDVPPGRFFRGGFGHLPDARMLPRKIGGVKVAVAALDFHVCECPGERAGH